MPGSSNTVVGTKWNEEEAALLIIKKGTSLLKSSTSEPENAGTVAECWPKGKEPCVEEVVMLTSKENDRGKKGMRREGLGMGMVRGKIVSNEVKGWDFTPGSEEDGCKMCVMVGTAVPGSSEEETGIGC